MFTTDNSAPAPEKPPRKSAAKAAPAKKAKSSKKKAAPKKKTKKVAPGGRAARKAAKRSVPAAAASPASSARPDGLRAGSKEAMMLDLACAPGGATEASICKALGWKKCRVTLKRTCEKAGAVLTSTGTGAERVWQATMPARKGGAS